jgi:bifunctional UDP-N-acetylglucosamine pyrophosphorylase / glucosamine-1-phosphate N-acetyltransferase
MTVAAATVLILAAGEGTRMRSSRPKVLHELCGRPMVLWPVQAALDAGVERVVVVDSPRRSLEAVLPAGVELAVQEHPDGTAGAVQAGLSALPQDGRATAGAVVVLSGDVPLVDAGTIRELAAAHERSGAAATMVTATLSDPSGYGRVVRDAAGGVARVVETKREGDATAEELEIREVNTGIYAFERGALAQALPRLSADNAQGERYLPDVLAVLREQGRPIAAHAADDERLVLGINDRLALARVRRLAQEAIHERHMRAGVDIVDPRATVIDVDVRIGQDTVIEPFTSIRGRTLIGAGCTVRQSYLIDCTLEDGVSVGPFAYLRPGAVLRAGAKVGTFVEVKNSDIGPGAKVPHLSYVGDAEVGERTNLGAGSITANYDGHAKHRTKIGKHVHGGVNTSYVAPVTVGDEAYTAAGSVLTEDVPEGALGVARARQENIEGYAERAKLQQQGRALHSEEQWARWSRRAPNRGGRASRSTTTSA